MSTLDDDLLELESAEDFFDYFAVPYDRAVVQVNRLHILQRFHDYITRLVLPPDDAGWRAAYRDALARAYADFVHSDAQTEKVFKVFRQQAGTACVPLGALKRWGADDAAPV